MENESNIITHIKYTQALQTITQQADALFTLGARSQLANERITALEVELAKLKEEQPVPPVQKPARSKGVSDTKPTLRQVK